MDRFLRIIPLISLVFLLGHSIGLMKQQATFTKAPYTFIGSYIPVPRATTLFQCGIDSAKHYSRPAFQFDPTAIPVRVNQLSLFQINNQGSI